MHTQDACLHRCNVGRSAGPELAFSFSNCSSFFFFMCIRRSSVGRVTALVFCRGKKIQLMQLINNPNKFIQNVSPHC